MADFFTSTLGAGRGRQNNIFLDWARQADAPHPERWSAPEAYFAVLFGAATCDGELAGAEHETLLALVHRSRALKALSPEQHWAVSTRVTERLAAGRADALAGACAALPAEARLPVFAQALDITLADAELSEAEARFLDELAAQLELGAADVDRIAGVMMVKNRY